MVNLRRNYSALTKLSTESIISSPRFSAHSSECVHEGITLTCRPQQINFVNGEFHAALNILTHFYTNALKLKEKNGLVSAIGFMQKIIITTIQIFTLTVLSTKHTVLPKGEQL